MNGELIAALDYYEKEKGIERETMVKAIEDALAAAALKRKDQPSRGLKVAIDRKTGDIHATVNLIVADVVRDLYSEIGLLRARRFKPDAKAGDEVMVELDPRDFGRIAAQAAKQALMQRQRSAEKEIIFVEFKDRVGDIVSGTVRRFERSDVYVDLGKFEAKLPSRERVSTEEYQSGDRIRAYVLAVENEAHGPEIILTRSHPNFVRRLFELEVSEISDKTVEIKSIAREAGFRTKLAVATRDEKVDPVGACVGMRGARVKNIVRELNGEKVDIIRWHPNIRDFVAEAMKPAKIKSMELDEANKKIAVRVGADELSSAVGKRGQNARLTSKLVGWHVTIEKDEASEAAFEDKLSQVTALLSQSLGVPESVASVLVRAGFSSVEAIQSAEPADLEQISGITSDQALAIFELAQRKAANVPPTIAASSVDAAAPAVNPAGAEASHPSSSST
ncbi:MAG: transcription termination/antitermination protein NusA [Verrucomicrobia bacterium]|nr:transcription termination/antitermination protein NusA [Verrucomicrobiota bacterium]